MDSADEERVIPSSTSPASSTLVHVGRQPIYDRNDRVVGYELLFRGSADSTSAAERDAHATSQVIVNAFTEFGLPQLVGDRLCFINMTRDFLVGALPLPFGPDGVVLEVLETIAVDDEVVAGVGRLVKAGYRIALDDFVRGSQHERLIDNASYVKLEAPLVDRPVLMDVIAQCRERPGISLVAERLETPEEVAEAHRLGFDLFQGYALGRPQVMSAVSLSPSRMSRLELLSILPSVDADLDAVASIVVRDPALSYRVLRATNSVSSGLARKIHSVRHAVLLLGAERLRDWVLLMVLSDVSEADDAQLAEVMTRAKMCQVIAERLGQSGEGGFTVGLLSGVADLMGLSPQELVRTLPLAPEVTSALDFSNGFSGLGGVLQLVRIYESGDVTGLARLVSAIGDLPREYLTSVRWATEMTTGALSGDD
jgi:EAL and modified HD-GYP domain-containing signal transduction protein